jgi:hypothetical protein
LKKQLFQDNIKNYININIKLSKQFTATINFKFYFKGSNLDQWFSNQITPRPIFFSTTYNFWILDSKKQSSPLKLFYLPLYPHPFNKRYLMTFSGNLLKKNIFVHQVCLSEAENFFLVPQIACDPFKIFHDL